MKPSQEILTTTEGKRVFPLPYPIHREAKNDHQTLYIAPRRTISLKQALAIGSIVIASLTTGYVLRAATQPITPFSQPYAIHMQHAPSPSDLLVCVKDANCMDIVQDDTEIDESALEADHREGGQR